MNIKDEAVEAFTQYRRKQIAELRPYQNGEDMIGVSISAEDYKRGSPKPGDMIARNPKNHADQWLVAAAYFADNFEPITALPHVSRGAVSGLTISAAIKDALHELDNVTAISDEDANCLGCAENLLRQALDALASHEPTPEEIDAAFWSVDAALGGQSNEA